MSRMKQLNISKCVESIKQGNLTIFEFPDCIRYYNWENREYGYLTMRTAKAVFNAIDLYGVQIPGNGTINGAWGHEITAGSVLPLDLWERLTGIRLCVKHTGKMTGLWSVSTSCEKNPYCIKRMKNPDMICAHCFSESMQNTYSGLREKLLVNSDLLSAEKLTIFPDLTGIPTNQFRFESFGDLSTAIQAYNYFKIAEMNPSVNCALWTKNPWIVEIALASYADMRKPVNLVCIGSSYFTNKPMIAFYRQYSFIDYIFTVYDKKYIRKNGINITCGARSCASCTKCYTGTHSEYEIREMLK